MSVVASDASVVSVVIPVLNGAGTIADCLRAALSQRVPGKRVEVIVVDNGSSDNTPKIVAPFPVRLLHEPVRGPSAARNRGLHEARGAILACVDSDMLPCHRWLERLTAPLTDAGVHLVAGVVTGFKPTSAAERYAEARGNYSRASTVDNPKTPFAPGGNLAVRRDEALAISGWTADMPSGEDVDFSLRLCARFPGPIAYAAEAVAFHRHRLHEDALRRQAHWWGQGLWHLTLRHELFPRWSLSRSIRMRLYLAAQRGGSRVVGAMARARIVSAQRAEYERLHARWQTHYWDGFFAARRACPAPPSPRGPSA